MNKKEVIEELESLGFEMIRDDNKGVYPFMYDIHGNNVSFLFRNGMWTFVYNSVDDKFQRCKGWFVRDWKMIEEELSIEAMILLYGGI